MTVTAADIKALPSGEFSALSDAVIDAAIAQAERRIDSGTWGTSYDDGVTNLTAHILCIGIRGGRGAQGPVVSESAGSLSRTYAAYATFDAKDKQLNASPYGQAFVQLRAELGIMGFSS